MNPFNELYRIDERTGAIAQRDLLITQKYDLEYVSSRYDKYESTDLMSRTRTDLVFSVFSKKFKRNPNSVVDFGCGNGSFLKACSERMRSDIFGIDASDYPFDTYGIQRIKSLDEKTVDVVTFFDSLEHVINPFETLKGLRCDMVCISVPWCHYSELGPDWFMEWKHRRPGEHLWHFGVSSLTRLFNLSGFKLASCSNIEDRIRKHDHWWPNILTCLFYRK